MAGRAWAVAETTSDQSSAPPLAPPLESRDSWRGELIVAVARAVLAEFRRVGHERRASQHTSYDVGALALEDHDRDVREEPDRAEELGGGRDCDDHSANWPFAGRQILLYPGDVAQDLAEDVRLGAVVLALDDDEVALGVDREDVDAARSSRFTDELARKL